MGCTRQLLRVKAVVGISIWLFRLPLRLPGQTLPQPGSPTAAEPRFRPWEFATTLWERGIELPTTSGSDYSAMTLEELVREKEDVEDLIAEREHAAAEDSEGEDATTPKRRRAAKIRAETPENAVFDRMGFLGGTAVPIRAL